MLVLLSHFFFFYLHRFVHLWRQWPGAEAFPRPGHQNRGRRGDPGEGRTPDSVLRCAKDHRRCRAGLCPEIGRGQTDERPKWATEYRVSTVMTSSGSGPRYMEKVGVHCKTSFYVWFWGARRFIAQSLNIRHTTPQFGKLLMNGSSTVEADLVMCSRVTVQPYKAYKPYHNYTSGLQWSQWCHTQTDLNHIQCNICILLKSKEPHQLSWDQILRLTIHGNIFIPKTTSICSTPCFSE